MLKEWIAVVVALAAIAGAFMFASHRGLIPKVVDPERTLSSTRPGDGFEYYSGYATGGGNNLPAMYASRASGTEEIVVVGPGFRASFPMSHYEEAAAAYRKLMQERGYHPFTPAVLPMAPHPILGTWTLKTTDGVCTETQVWEASGQGRNHSAQEESTTRFEIAAQPGGKGTYPMIDTVVSTNGQPDCYGHKMPAGDVRTEFLRFAADGQSLRICTREDQDSDECPITGRRQQTAP